MEGRSSASLTVSSTSLVAIIICRRSLYYFFRPSSSIWPASKTLSQETEDQDSNNPIHSRTRLDRSPSLFLETSPPRSFADIFQLRNPRYSHDAIFRFWVTRRTPGAGVNLHSKLRGCGLWLSCDIDGRRLQSCGLI
jgi:hypothetical protein